MGKYLKISSIRAVTFFMLTLGILLVVVSAFYFSSFLVILGVAIVFWGTILLYIMPTKHVPLALLSAATISAMANIENFLEKTHLSSKGKYLPPNLLKDFESSIVLISERSGESLPTPEDAIWEKLGQDKLNSIYITAPGWGLSKLFEQKAGHSFIAKDLNFVQRKFPKILVEDMGLAQAVDLEIRKDTVVLELSNSVLQDVCEETKNLPRTHNQVGCLLSSAVACVLAKASGKVVTIEKDELSENGEITRMEFKLWDV